MTALKQYQRLEATGLWRPDPDAQRREVVVSLGEATLTISDMSERVLGHWSLAAIARASAAGERPAIYHPDADPSETLELDAGEETMIEALDRILRAVERRRPQPGRLRFWIAGVAGLAMMGAAVFWLPGALLGYATGVVPKVKRAEIGTALLTRITRVAGQPCTSGDGPAALDRLGQRLLGAEASGGLTVLPGGLQSTAHLPGGRILLDRALVEDPDDPDVTAGYVLAEAVRAGASDPLADLLRQAGLFASLKLITTGALPEAALDRYAEYIVATPPVPVPAPRLLAAFDAAELRATPYAYAVDPTGESTLPLIEADPRANAESRAVLNDADWLRLQSICDG